MLRDLRGAVRTGEAPAVVECKELAREPYARFWTDDWALTLSAMRLCERALGPAHAGLVPDCPGDGIPDWRRCGWRRAREGEGLTPTPDDLTTTRHIW